MKIEIPQAMLTKIKAHGEAAYPDEGAGLLFGREKDGVRKVADVFPLTNAREDDARHNRYLITPEDMLRGEQESSRRKLDVLGVFHSHPDHPAEPSEFDREWGMPWFSYVITSIGKGKAGENRCWRLTEDREGFEEEEIVVIEKVK